MTTNPTMARATRGALLALFAGLFLFIYAVLHESGHALVGLLSGAQIAAFDISFFGSGPHVEMVGGSGGRSPQVLNNLAGMGLPLILWTIFLLLAPRRGSPALELLKVVGSMCVFNTLVVWFVFPVLFLAGSAPAGEDATRFLQNSGVPPLLAAGFFFLLYIALWVLLLRRVEPFAKWKRRFLDANDAEWSGPGVRQTAVGLVGAAALAGVVVIAANLPGLRGSPPPLPEPPAGYTLNTAASLAEPREGAAAAAFAVAETAEVGVFLRLRAVACNTLDARLNGPGGFDTPLLHGEGYSAGADTVEWSGSLTPGEYRLTLTTRGCSGNLDLFVKK